MTAVEPAYQQPVSNMFRRGKNPRKLQVGYSYMGSEIVNSTIAGMGPVKPSFLDFTRSARPAAFHRSERARAVVRSVPLCLWAITCTDDGIMAMPTLLLHDRRERARMAAPLGGKPLILLVGAP